MTNLEVPLLDTTAASRQWWPPALSTMLVVLGTTVADSEMGTDIWPLTLRRIAMMLALAVVAAALVGGLDRWRARRTRDDMIEATGA